MLFPHQEHPEGENDSGNRIDTRDAIRHNRRIHGTSLTRGFGIIKKEIGNIFTNYHVMSSRGMRIRSHATANLGFRVGSHRALGHVERVPNLENPIKLFLDYNPTRTVPLQNNEMA